MKLSIVATLYQSAPYIDEFYQRATDAAKRLTDDYEIVLVNDGSPDDSLVRAVRLAESDGHVVVVDLISQLRPSQGHDDRTVSRHGEQVFLIDSDLEEEPEWLLSFSAADGAGQMRCCLWRAGTAKRGAVRAMEWGMVLPILSGAHRVDPAGKHCHRPVDDASLC